MDNDKQLNVIKYLLRAVDIGYIKGVTFNKVTPFKISMDVNVFSNKHIQPVRDMIEANMYTDSSLMCTELNHLKKHQDIGKNSALSIKTSDGMTYIINVKEVETK